MSTTTGAVVKEDLLLAAPSVAVEVVGERKRPGISIVAYGGGIMRVPGWGDVAVELSGLDLGEQVPLLCNEIAA